MATAGYSGTALWKKLGIKPTHKLLFIHAPDNYPALIEIPVRGQLAGKKDTPDLIHLFVKNKAEFMDEMKKINSFIHKNPSIVIWVSWYKKASGIATDITEDTIRDYALKNDLVDVKVCAVSDIWSGLKLVVPLAKR